MAQWLQPPFPLYVDEITPDKIKATAKDFMVVSVNVRILTKYGNMSFGEAVNGIYLFPAGRYICMMVKSTHARRAADGMVLLDLVERPDLAYEMGEKFAGTDLRGKFSVCYTFILDHPETHGMFKVVEDPLPGFRGRESIFPLKPPPPYES
jgi:hypothetical protein